jgi:hypothetical protein
MIEKQEEDAERTERLERCILIIAVAICGTVTVAWTVFVFWFVLWLV